jgi:hypothetical protein
MNRREAISTVSLLVGGTVIGAESFLAGCASPEDAPDGILSISDINLLDEIAETILPKTESSPGAKDAEVGKFMNVIITECYDPDEQQIFTNGLITFKETVKNKFGKNYERLILEEKHELLRNLENEVKNYTQSQTEADPDTHYYRMIKQLTLLGFLTSKPGVTQAMRHAAVPGRYDGCVPYEEGEKAWA